MRSKVVRRTKRKKNQLKRNRRKTMMIGMMLKIADRQGGPKREIKRKSSGMPKRRKVKNKSKQKLT